MLLANTLRKVDLQDLLVFLEVFERQNLGDAGEALSLSPSTLSYCLKKLRAAFADELFIVTRQGMQPTRKAQAMRPLVRDAVERINACLDVASEFDPGRAQRSFKLCAPEYFELLVLPALLRRLQATGHGIGLEVRRLGRDIPLQELLDGELDLALGFGPNLHRASPELLSQPLLHDELRCVQDAAQLPLADLDEFCARHHVFPTPWDSERNMIDGWLQEQGRSRRLAARANSYVAALQLIPGSDLLLMLPTRVHALLGDARTRACPVPSPGLPSFSLDMLWALPFDQDPANIWLREQLLSVCAELETQ